MYPSLWQDARFPALLLRVDQDVAVAARKKGCPQCGGSLHAAPYERKPRGGAPGLGEEYNQRFSFCCAEDGCRKRHTPSSLRFLGRKVYLGAVVVLVSAMRHGATPARMRKLREHLGVSRRAVERWRKWWRETFAESAFWRAARAAFVPAVDPELLPVSLLERFAGDDEARLVALLRFLSPITGGAGMAQAR